MPAVIIAIADAVVADLNAASLSQAFTAVRAYVPVYELADDFDDLMVTVVPISLTLAMISRRDDDFDYVVDVAVQKRIGKGLATQAAIIAAADPLMQLVEEILDHFRGKRPDAYPTALCVAATNAPIYAHAHLDEHRVFTSVLSLTFRVARAR